MIYHSYWRRGATFELVLGKLEVHLFLPRISKHHFGVSVSVLPTLTFRWSSAPWTVPTNSFRVRGKRLERFTWGRGGERWKRYQAAR